MTTRNNIGFNSKGSEDIATEITKIAGSDLSKQCCLMPPHHGSPTNISKNLTLPESRLRGVNYIFAVYGMGYLFFNISSERRMLCAVECGTAVQGHPRSFFCSNRKG